MRVLVTRPRKDADEFAAALQDIGAEAVFFPTIAIRPIADTTLLDRALSRLNCYDWLVLTSANAVDVVLERLADLDIHALPQNIRVAAVGPKTAARLIAANIQPEFVPEKYVAEAVVPGLGDLCGRWVLLPMADIAHDTLPQAIQAADGIAHVITAYHTVTEIEDIDIESLFTPGIDVITFTSGSSVLGFLSLLKGTSLDALSLPGEPLIGCIGPKTARVAQEAGLRVGVIAKTHTIQGLVEAIAAKLFGDYSHVKN
ncbi:MAG: uroporphyrinogen-III synthase [Anaerolineales bacterium]|nr:uroporphyrinogen-III synthase [Anaerolineales bacterium]